MSEWSETYRLGICEPSELAELQRFIQLHWKNNHPLAVHRGLMDWQHLDRETGCYNFLLARHRADKEIHGILGFIPVSQFDDALRPERDLWLAIWKVRDDVSAPGLGLSLLFDLIERYKPRSLAAVGISPIARSIYAMLGYRLGTLSHYYLLHPHKLEFRLVARKDMRKFEPSAPFPESDKRFIRCDAKQFERLAAQLDWSGCSLAGHFPAKSPRYWICRYLDHPIYEYETYAIRSESDPNALAFIALRQAEHDGASALRIVDYGGDPAMLADTGACFAQLLEKYDAEYVDFYQFGLDHVTMDSAGFTLGGADSEVVVPNYFEPFEQRNVNIDFAYKADKKVSCFICKGDSDQDRPNIIPG